VRQHNRPPRQRRYRLERTTNSTGIPYFRPGASGQIICFCPDATQGIFYGAESDIPGQPEREVAFRPRKLRWGSLAK